MEEVAVPGAFKVPFTVIEVPLNFTITPGLMVRVTPEAMEMSAVMMKVEEAVVQVWLVVILLEMVVAAEANTGVRKILTHNRRNFFMRGE